MSQDPDVISRSEEELLAGLNPQQAEAVRYRGPALLIGAGAGSGKTRVLTRRIAWLLSELGVWPGQILAITFTNKAAGEMRERLGKLIGPAAQRMWVSTFHSACVRILRRDGRSIGLSSGFSIYDTADSERLVKNICADLNVDVKRFTPRSILARISDSKNALKDWRHDLVVQPAVAATTGAWPAPVLHAVAGSVLALLVADAAVTVAGLTSFDARLSRLSEDIAAAKSRRIAGIDRRIEHDDRSLADRAAGIRRRLTWSQRRLIRVFPDMSSTRHIRLVDEVRRTLRDAGVTPTRWSPAASRSRRGRRG